MKLLKTKQLEEKKKSKFNEIFNLKSEFLSILIYCYTYMYDLKTFHR